MADPGARLLIVDDNKVNRLLLSRNVQMQGHRAELAENGRVALEMLDKATDEQQPYDLLLTDIQMPEMDGHTLTQTLRERGCAIPIIALTAHAMEEDRQKCFEAGCDDYTSKPINKVQLLKLCSHWIGRQSSAASKEHSVSVS